MRRLKDIFSAKRPATGQLKAAVLPREEQVEAWRKASKKMRWRIGAEEFRRLPLSSPAAGDGGSALFYGFDDDGGGNADPVLSGKLAWDYALKTRKKEKVWQSPYIDFCREDAFRLRPGAPSRPKGFYFASVLTGGMVQTMSVVQTLKSFIGETGWGPEGFQFLCVTHPHFIDLMSERIFPFVALADYEVAPYGYNDFIDAPQLFSSNGILGLGIGNVDQHYTGFAVPALVLPGM